MRRRAKPLLPDEKTYFGTSKTSRVFSYKFYIVLTTRGGVGLKPELKVTCIFRGEADLEQIIRESFQVYLDYILALQRPKKG